MPESQLLAQPNPLLLATYIEGLLEIGGSYFLEGIPQGWNSANFAVGSVYTVGPDNITRNNTDGGNEVVIGVMQIPKNQPWMTMFSMNDVSTNPSNPFDVFVGVKDNLGRLSGINPYRYPPETAERFHVIMNGHDISGGGGYLNGAQSDLHQIYSDGLSIHFLRYYNGQFHESKEPQPIPDDTLWYKFYYYLYHHGNFIYTLRVRVDDAIVPVTTYNSTLTEGLPPESPDEAFRPIPNLILRVVDSTHYGVVAQAIDNWNLILTNIHAHKVLNIPVHSDALYIRPKDRSCGGYAIFGENIEFESNGGNGGIFEADGGTVLPDLKWQAPFASGDIHFTYRIGEATATCLLHTVPKLTVAKVNEEGFFPDMAQGESAQFTSTCPEARFECTNYPTLVSRTGYITAPTDAKNAVFGEKWANIKVTGCGQIYTFKVHIQAMYPTPRFCGATPHHWMSPDRPDYLPNTLIMTGGTSQVKNRNKQGILIWEVEYQGLRYSAPVGCSCSDPLTHQENCTLDLETAKRLDDFYKLVKFTNYFTVVDIETEMMYKYVRLTKFDGSHNLFETEQTRNVTMRQEGDVLFDSIALET